MSSINPMIQKIADRMRSEMDRHDGGYNEVPKELYEEHLPEHLTMKIVEDVMGHNENMTTALVLANGQEAIERMQKEKDLQKMSTRMKYGRFGDATANFERSVEGRKSVQDPTIVTRYGSSGARLKTTAGRNRGELKKVRESLSEQAENLFK